MFKEIGKLKGLLNYPQQLILGLDNIAHVNGDDLTLIITSEECAELIQAIQKEEELRKETEKHGTCE